MQNIPWKAFETCSISEMQIIQSFETCSISEMQIIQPFETCSISEMQIIQSFETCSISEMQIIQPFETCSISEIIQPKILEIPRGIPTGTENIGKKYSKQIDNNKYSLAHIKVAVIVILTLCS